MRLLRQPGIEVSDKTEKLPLPDSAVQILRRTPLAPLRKGSCQRKSAEGSQKEATPPTRAQAPEPPPLTQGRQTRPTTQ